MTRDRELAQEVEEALVPVVHARRGFPEDGHRGWVTWCGKEDRLLALIVTPDWTQTTCRDCVRAGIQDSPATLKRIWAQMHPNVRSLRL